MTKIKGMIPIYASGRFSIDKPENWDDMTDDEKKDYFLDKMQRGGSLCHHCSNQIETDYEMNWDWSEMAPAKDLIKSLWEEER